MTEDKITVENINTPGRTSRVNAAKYTDMRQALMRAMPNSVPGAPFSDILHMAKQHLSDDLFPAGKTSGWWAKTVQLDLEAKGLIARTKGSPLKFYKV